MNNFAENRPKQEKLAENLSKLDNPGMTIRQAFTDAGYSEHTANGGWQNVPNRVVRLLAKKGIRLKELGKIDIETQEQLVRGRLVYNTIKGSDKGVLSAKALGSDRRVNMFTTDNATGIIVLQIPQTVQTMSDEERNQLLAPPKE